jgi:cytochrome c oxidase accessory protein FixG
MNAMDPQNRLTPNDYIVESAPGVVHYDVEAVARSKDQVGGYASRTKIYSKEAHGTFRRVKWLVMAVTLGIYYLLPWLRWDRGPGAPDQAFLLDFAHQRLYFGPLEIWAQEFYYITGLLVLSALGLFLVTSIAGRMWCGYACPQTVWTDLMIAIERFWQGDRAARMRLDKERMSFTKAWKKTATHVSWMLVGLLTGGALVFYFRDAPTLAVELVNGTAPMVAYVFLGIFTFFTYLLGGIAREQVCIYMCPWPRIQGAMLDHDSLLVAYRSGRGEPRSPYRRGDSWDDRGDCIDCKACIAVCPTGIDIRNGAQLECIQCALCIDACDEVMDRLNRPKGLIAYTTVGNVEKPDVPPRDGWRIFRPRTILYTVVMTLIGGLMVWSLLSRDDMHMSVEADRNPLFITLSDGSIRNGYTIKVVNKTDQPRQLRVGVEGLAGADLSIVGYDGADSVIEAPAADVLAIKVFVTLTAADMQSIVGLPAPVTLLVKDIANGATRSDDSVFHGPKP